MTGQRREAELDFWQTPNSAASSKSLVINRDRVFTLCGWLLIKHLLVRSALLEFACGRYVHVRAVCGEAGDGREAVEKAQQLWPDLVLTDLSMPVMNGLEECRTLKKIMPEVPVIIVTAHLDPFIEKEAFSAGASAVISKAEQITTLIGKAKSVSVAPMFDRMAA